MNMERAYRIACFPEDIFVPLHLWIFHQLGIILRFLKCTSLMKAVKRFILLLFSVSSETTDEAFQSCPGYLLEKPLFKRSCWWRVFPEQRQLSVAIYQEIGDGKWHLAHIFVFSSESDIKNRDQLPLLNDLVSDQQHHCRIPTISFVFIAFWLALHMCGYFWTLLDE